MTALPRCQGCGSANILRDAWARWDEASACWEVAALFDHATCEDCGRETALRFETETSHTKEHATR